MKTTQQNRLNRLFGADMSDLFGSLARIPQHASGGLASVWEEDGHYQIEVDLPGVAREDVDITFDHGALTIAAERPAPDSQRWVDERHYGRISRVVSLPESADTGSIEAELTAGVLRVTVAKSPEAQPRKIEVKAS